MGDIIISEFETREEERIVHRSNIGGYHSGHKYRQGNILFKLPAYPQSFDSLFMGNYELAQKTLGNEIRAVVVVDDDDCGDRGDCDDDVIVDDVGSSEESDALKNSS